MATGVLSSSHKDFYFPLVKEMKTLKPHTQLAS